MSTSVNNMTEYASILLAEVRSQSQSLLFLRRYFSHFLCAAKFKFSGVRAPSGHM